MQAKPQARPFSIPFGVARSPQVDQRPRAIDLQSHGVLLRSVRPGDIDERFIRSVAKQKLDGYVIQPGEQLSPEFLKHHLAQFDEVHAHLLSVVSVASQELLGLMRLQVNRLHNVAHLILLFDMQEEAYLRLLSDCIPVLAGELFAHHGIAKLSLNVLDRKTALIQALKQSAVFHHEGVLRGEHQGDGLQRHDVMVYGLLNPNNIPKP